MKIVATVLVVALLTVVGCADFANTLDAPSTPGASVYPCGEPQDEWCPGHKSCCPEQSVCMMSGPAIGECEDTAESPGLDGVSYRRRRPQVVAQ